MGDNYGCKVERSDICFLPQLTQNRLCGAGVPQGAAARGAPAQRHPPRSRSPVPQERVSTSHPVRIRPVVKVEAALTTAVGREKIEPHLAVSEARAAAVVALSSAGPPPPLVSFGSVYVRCGMLSFQRTIKA